MYLFKSLQKKAYGGVKAFLPGLFVLGFLFGSSYLWSHEEGKVLPDGSVMVISTKPFDEVVSALTQAIEEQNLMVIHIIDGQKMMRMAGKKIGGMKQIFFFHPRYMRKVWETNPLAGIRIPLKFIVMEKSNGKVVIRYLKPSTLLGSYEKMASIASELDAIVDKIAHAAAAK